MAPSPTEEIVRLPAHAHRYVEGNADHNDQQPEVGTANSRWIQEMTSLVQRFLLLNNNNYTGNC